MNQRSTPDRSGMAKPVFWSIHQEMKVATQLSASGLQVALMYGLTPHIERLRDTMYQNWLAVKCVSSSKPMNGICAPCQSLTLLSYSRPANEIEVFSGNSHQSVLDFGSPPTSGYILALSSQSAPSFLIWTVVRRKITPPKPLSSMWRNGSSRSAQLFPPPAAPP